jgi:hypothetical protein
MKTGILAVGLLITASVASADDAEARAQIAGTWVVSAPGGAKDTWTIADEEGSVRLTHDQDGKVAEFACKTTGQECSFKGGGRDAKVSMWFSGPKLVQLEMVGNNVVKRRFGVVDEGKVLEVEVIPVVPPGKAETVRFTRVEDAPEGVS